MAIRFDCHLIQHGTSIPLGIGKKVVERLIVAVWHDLLHALHVFATGLHQALQVLLSLGTDRARPAPEMRLEALGEILKPKPHPFEPG